MKQKYGTKIRIITAIEKGDVRLLAHLLNTQKHAPDKPVDKLGNNIFHVACTMGNLAMLQHIYTTYQPNIHGYNTDGMNCMHLATCSVNLDIMKWLWEQGVDCQSKTLKYHKTSYDMICEMISNNDYPDNYQSMTRELKKKMIEVKNFLRARYFEDMRGLEIRKFLWFWNQLKSKNQDIGRLPQGIIREIGEYI